MEEIKIGEGGDEQRKERMERKTKEKRKDKTRER